jgi:hypothetical protein
MSKQFLIFLGIGILVVAIVLAFTWEGTKGAHLDLEGKILKVRTLATDEKNTIVVVDFRVRNLAKVQFMWGDGVVKIVKDDGKEVQGDTISRSDMERVFDYYKLLGPKYNEILVLRDRIAGGAMMDRTIGVQFPLPQAVVDQRRNLTLTLNDIDGPSFTFPEK